MKGDPIRRAIVLSGGGARGAYEAGVLSFVLDEIPRRLGRPISLDIVCGTSVGAIHACYLAATAHEESGRGRTLAHIWEEMALREVFRTSPIDLLRIPLRMLNLYGKSSLHPDAPLPDRLPGLLDTTALETLVRKAISWKALHRNISTGRLDAVSVAATEIATGRIVVFVESRHPTDLRWKRNPGIVARSASLAPDHALASAAIPGLFPAVRLQDRFYTDGGLRLNTPLSPALRLGADRVLVIALRHGLAGQPALPVETGRVEYSASPIFLMGKALDALMLDPVDRDLRQMRLLNDVLRRAEEIAGTGFLRRINEVVRHDRGQPFKIVDDLVIRPSTDLGVLAREAAENARTLCDTPLGLRLALRALSFGHNQFEAELLSYLFFDRSYTAPLYRLGFLDAQSQEESLMAFFSD